MAVSILLANGMPSLLDPSLEGLIRADAVAAPAYSVTATAALEKDLTIADNTGLTTGTYIQINGAGPAGANDWFSIQYLGTYAVGGTTTLTIEDGQNASLGKAVTTAVTNAVAKMFYPVFTRFQPYRVSIINLNTRIRYEWRNGMACNSALKTDAAGATTLITDSAIVVDAKGFYTHPDLIGVNEQVAFEVRFATPSL
jgi:hypothetical protein